MPDYPRFLLVGLDGLRPDLLNFSLTPNIARLQRHGVTLARHRTVYPSETRVAFPSLVTGATCDRHGMVGNKYVDRTAAPTEYLDTSDANLLRRLDQSDQGRLMTADSLGEILYTAKKTLAVLSTNTAGTTRLFHHRAEAYGHVRLSGHFAEVATPKELLAVIEARFGRLPVFVPGVASRDAQALITSAFLELVWPHHAPDVTILSYGEPDTTSHFHGTGSRTTLDIIACCDREIGRLVDWWEVEGRAAGVQFVILSDHGHITGHTRISVLSALREAGFQAAHAPGPDVEVIAVPGQVGALYLSEPNRARICQLVEALVAEPWCGPIFTKGRNDVDGVAPGSFARHLVGAEHARAPDVYFAFRTDDRLDPFGLVGGTFYDNERRPGLGVHGGLHPKELGAVAILAGDHFHADGRSSEIPTGICDIAPTVLHALGLPCSASMTGRILDEARRDGRSATPVTTSEVYETGIGSYRQGLRRVRVGSAVYLDGGWAETTAVAQPSLEAAL